MRAFSIESVKCINTSEYFLTLDRVHSASILSLSGRIQFHPGCWQTMIGKIWRWFLTSWFRIEQRTHWKRAHFFIHFHGRKFEKTNLKTKLTLWWKCTTFRRLFLWPEDRWHHSGSRTDTVRSRRIDAPWSGGAAPPSRSYCKYTVIDNRKVI